MTDEQSATCDNKCTIIMIATAENTKYDTIIILFEFFSHKKSYYFSLFDFFSLIVSFAQIRLYVLVERRNLLDQN